MAADILEQPPLLVTLLEDVGKLPKGLVYSLPRPVSEALILRRLAVPVGSLGAFPDIFLEDENELAEAGIDWPLIQAS